MTETKQNNDIDIINLLYHILKKLIKHKFFILIFIILGISYTIFKTYYNKNSYENITIYRFNTNDLIELTNVIKENIKDNELPISSRRLPVVYSIKTDSLKKYLVLKIVGNDKTDISITKNNIISDYNNLFKEAIDLNIKRDKELLVQMQRNLMKLDSLQKYIMASFNGQNKNVFIQGSPFNDYADLYEKKINLEMEVSNLERDGIISAISSHDEIVSPGSFFKTLINSVIISIFISIFVSVTMVLIYELIKKINKNIKSISEREKDLK